MTDDLIRRLQREWQSQPVDASPILERLRRRRWMPHVVLALEILGCVLAFCAGVWFAWIAVNQADHRLLFGLSAVVLLVAAPAMAIAVAIVRRRALAWDSETPESILRIGILRADASLQAMRVGRWHLASVALFVAVLWVLQWLGLLDVAGFLVFYTSVCGAVSLVVWLWMRWRTRAVLAERATCSRLLGELHAESEDVR